MLNVGQVVYDYTNKRVLIFAGLEMLQNQKTGACHVEEGFMLKDGTYIHIKDKKERDFHYVNLTKDGRPYAGSFIKALGLGGHYFGIIAEDRLKKEDWEEARKAIEEMEALILEHGLHTTDHDNGSYTKYHIGKPGAEQTPKLSIDTPKVVKHANNQ